jgi:chaperonin cofactor prefoldin
MADLENRVATLEREMSDLKAKVGDHAAELQNIPDLIKTEFRLNSSQMARLNREVTELKGNMEAMPRFIAEILKETKAEIIREMKNLIEAKR